MFDGEDALEADQRRIHRDHVSQIVADGGPTEVLAAIAELPGNRVHGSETMEQEVEETC